MIEYTLQGGDEGANRLDILSNTLQSSTENFLKTLGIHEGANCLDLGCGTGNVTCIIAKIIGNRGNVLGLDINEKNIQLAVESAKTEAIKNVNFKYFDAYLLREKFVYDVIYSRFLLSHLTNPKTVLQNTLDALKPGQRLFLLSSGTGFAPFSSLIREPETYEKFEKVIVTHTCRTVKELEYSQQTIIECNNDEIVSEIIANKLLSYDSTTREDYTNQGRITDLITSKKLFRDLNISQISSNDRFMFCGSMGLNNDLKEILLDIGLSEGANNNPAEFVLEKAFVG